MENSVLSNAQLRFLFPWGSLLSFRSSPCTRLWLVWFWLSICYYGSLCWHIMEDTYQFSFPSFIPSYHYFKHLHIPLALNVDCLALSPDNLAVSWCHVNGLGSLHSCFPLSLLDFKKVGIHFNSCFTHYILNDESLFCWCFTALLFTGVEFRSELWSFLILM